MACLFFVHFCNTFCKFLIFPCNVSIIFTLMRYNTVCTIFISTFCVGKISSTVFSQRIKRAIAEKTVKFLRICTLMAGKIFTFFMAEKGKFFSFPIWFLHLCLLHTFTHFPVDIRKISIKKRERCYFGVEKQLIHKCAEGTVVSEAVSPAI